MKRVALKFKNAEYRCGNVVETSNKKTLVKFDIGYSRWCNNSNLVNITTNK